MTEFTTRREGDVTVFAVSGRLTLGNTLMQIERELKQTIESGVRRLVLDLSGLTYLDSAGVGMLVAAAGQMEQAGGRLMVAGATGSVERMFKIVHLDRVLDVRTDVASALQALGPVAKAG